eukprot:TRINITY_DN1200_c1_g1_i1.p1 TRINITY_DN1200_c1_g1~~TRINITY_DN1200_c1_g1_i1.p1  ORF type:complete len:512 (-),score=167.95 TRINITY_DN1200_c1_g1_i1:800-2335(-)
MILPKDLMLGGDTLVLASSPPVPHSGFSSYLHHSRYDALSERSNNFDFDLNLLDCEVPSLEITEPLPALNLDCSVPSSPSGSFDYYSSSSDVMSPTMFSPGSTCSMSSSSSSSIGSSLKATAASKYRGNPYERCPSSLENLDSSSPLGISESVQEFRELQASVNVKIEPLSHFRNDTPLLRQCLVAERTPVLEEEVKMEPVISLAVEQVKRDIHATCNLLCIGQDPCIWSKDDVCRWMQWTMKHYGIMSENPPFDCNGADLVKQTETDFLLRLPEGGDLLYAQLDIWKSSAEYCRSEMDPLSPTQNDPSIKNESRFDISAVLDILEAHSPSETFYDNNKQDAIGSPCSFDGMTSSSSSINSPGSLCTSPPPPPYSMAISQLNNRNNTLNSLKASAPEDEETDDTDDDDLLLKIPGHKTSNTNIHLWQFVKELLLQPDAYSGCIHWMDREKGIFKIVDSVKVATLWGKRKNRPAMNYDKLSRSLRQYYKKGIMKKTERSQRLVYQFCHPYHL